MRSVTAPTDRPWPTNLWVKLSTIGGGLQLEQNHLLFELTVASETGGWWHSWWYGVSQLSQNTILSWLCVKARLHIWQKCVSSSGLRLRDVAKIRNLDIGETTCLGWLKLLRCMNFSSILCLDPWSRFLY